MDDYTIYKIDGTTLTKEEKQIRELESAIAMTETVIDNGRHCDMVLLMKAIEGYKKRIEEIKCGIPKKV